LNHGPDGLSRRPPQQDDEEQNNADGFDDWIDNLYGFIHQVNSATTPAVVMILVNLVEDVTPQVDPDQDYSKVPRSNSACADDKKLVHIHQEILEWLICLDVIGNNYTTGIPIFMKI
jgi:hypothetical protein